ncbi:LysR family transcriptional regulator [Sorangium sp. So ce291]|uniref:LysR family transcriptional regulator n=1 Tax=Sorangium sp. So ce291 TaxID=3133294 RepID=UPI003F620A52
MRSPPVAQLPVFLAVAERRSFTKGARALGMSPSAASQAVARLEHELGTPLFVRTTRSVRLTDAGARLLHEAGPAIRSVCAALSGLKAADDEPSGVLRLNVPRIACRVCLPRLLEVYAQRCPKVRCDIVVDDRRVDIVKNGFDAGIRSAEAIHKDMVRVRLTGPLRFAVVASERYLASAGRPREPRDLTAHACLGWRSLADEGAYRWEFSDRGREVEVAVAGPVVSNDTQLLMACAEQGMGLAFVVEEEAAGEIASGRLQTVLDDYALQVPGLFLYFPRAARAAPNLRAFVACAREVLGAKGPRRRADAGP